ncbi:MAG TPA: CocE/NonD family hydrolase [Thermoleophilaceae bacterium]|nr:CocE/NonD family hydrolase [Thermoleophilaceae bacterium]
MRHARTAVILALLAALAVAAPASAATEREHSFTARAGKSQTFTWTDSGGGVLATQDTMTIVGCDPAPGVNDCDDTVIVVPRPGVLDVAIAPGATDDPVAQNGTIDADLELFQQNADGSLESLADSASATAEEALSQRVPAGAYVVRISYAIGVQATLDASAKFKAEAAPRKTAPGGRTGKHYRALGPKLSPAKHQVTEEKVFLPMADGREVYVEVTRPKKKGRYGVILESSPYHGTLYDRTGTRILPRPLDAKGNPQGLKGYFAPRGYAVVMMDLRGTGKSQGCLDHLGQNDASDLKTVIEWAADQPWSNGRVGMVGHSYVGSTPAVAAAQNPDGLVTIVPSAGLASMYDHQFHAGVPWAFQWIGPVIGYQGLAFARALPPDVPDAADPALEQAFGTGNTGDNFGNDPQEAACGMENNALLTHQSMASGQYVDYHEERDWRAGATAFDGSIFLIHGVNDEAARIESMNWFYDRGRKSDKAWIGQWDHGIGCCPNRRGMEWTYALHAWFDKTLLKRRIGTGPRVEVFLNKEASDASAIEGKDEVMTARAWPPKTKRVTFHAQPNGALATAKPEESDSQSFSGTPEGYVFGREGAPHVEFVSEPLKRNMLVVGLPKLQLAMSQTVPRLHVIVNIVQEYADDRRRVGNCAMNPELREGLDTITPVLPGEQMTLFPSCWTSAQELLKGNRLVLQVMTSDDDHVPTFATDPNVTVFAGEDQTKLTLPVAKRPKLLRDTAKTSVPPDPNATG